MAQHNAVDEEKRLGQVPGARGGSQDSDIKVKSSLAFGKWDYVSGMRRSVVAGLTVQRNKIALLSILLMIRKKKKAGRKNASGRITAHRRERHE